MNILNSNALVPVGGAYENLVVSSVGLKRFNLLGSSSSSNSAGVSSLGCVVSFSRYLMLKLVISALTVGICRSVCRSEFGDSNITPLSVTFEVPTVVRCVSVLALQFQRPLH